MNILLTGTNGILGKFLHNDLKLKTNLNIICNTRSICDLSSYENIQQKYGAITPDTIVHCAAYTDVKNSTKESQKVFDDNILASVNLIKFAIEKLSKFVFISTDFVFDGTKGMYKTDDLINPQTIYAKSKASIELALSCYSNSLIIRTSFFDKNFPFESACTDRYTSKDYIDIIGPMITSQILGEQRGIVHIGTERKSFYELASRRKHVNACLCMSDSDGTGKDSSFSYD
jgi:dTDP-4-dehydrorhamnose reductase